ncbi:MAG: HD domain-containing phosphohydrolase [Pseudomonadota bacterium]
MNRVKELVLIADDNPTNIDLLVNALGGDYRLGIAKNGAQALAYITHQRPDIALLDVMMPEMSGFEVCRELKADPKTRDIPVIFITALDDADRKLQGFELGAVDYVTKPFLAEEVRARVRTHLSMKTLREALEQQNIGLEQKVAEKTAELNRLLESTISVITFMGEIRDPYTAGHQQRVARLACAIGGRMGLAPERLRALELAAVLHDIGKIRIPTAISSRPGRLLDTERELLKIHPRVGYELLSTVPFPLPVAEIVLQHHERMDGSGYPAGLAGEAILLEARILSVADVTEAESSFRPYRPALGIAAALADIRRNRGRLYDAEAVDACTALFEEEGFRFES